MSKQQQDKVRELPLKADDRALDDDEIAEGRKRHGESTTNRRTERNTVAFRRAEPMSDRSTSQPTKDDFSEVCGND